MSLDSVLNPRLLNHMAHKRFLRSVALQMDDPLWVIIPCGNEEKTINGCLDNFELQTDSDFKTVVIDNSSEDGTGETVRHRQESGRLAVHVVQETKVGIGPACRAGCDYALQQGAIMIARTDA